MLLPWATVCEAGVAATVKGATTLRVTVVVWVMLPLVPVTVSVYEPIGVVDKVLTVKEEEAEPLTEDGVKAGVAPAGNPLTLSAVALPPGAETLTV